MGVSKSYDVPSIVVPSYCVLTMSFEEAVQFALERLHMEAGPLRQCTMDRTCLFAYQLDLEKVSTRPFLL